MKRRLKFTLILELDSDEVPTFKEREADGKFYLHSAYVPAWGEFIKFDQVELVD